MIPGMVYECVDGRPGNPLGGVVYLNQVPDGFEVWPYAGAGETLQFDDDDLEDDGQNLVLHTGAGAIYFNALTLSEYERMQGPSFFPLAPDFTSDADLRDWFRTRIVRADG